MKLKFIVLILNFLLVFIAGTVGQSQANNKDKIKIDSINIRKNWRTKESIILEELEIRKGDSVSTDQLRTAISKIWNIGNFAKVNYRIDTLKDDRLLLNVNAQDAFTIVPIFSFTGNKEEYLLTLGLNDNNFMGRNINLGMAGSFGTNAKYANISIGIPRQLLYRNMTLSGSFLLGEAQNYRYEKETKVSGIAYLQKIVGFSVGNPYHTDYYYTFSPNLGISYLNQKTDSTLLEQGVASSGNYNASYIGISTSESFGMINHIRHQRDGYLLSAGIGAGIGLNHESPGYVSLGLNFTYAKLVNQVIELDAGFSTNYTSSGLPSLINYLGPGQVKGILTGERSGQSIYAANASANFTYINRDWFAVEQSFFVNIGNATDNYLKLYTANPLFSMGSRVRFIIPMIPWMSINFYYAYRGNGKHWYSMDF
jgi:outer membrane protein assembly factor BamA